MRNPLIITYHKEPLGHIKPPSQWEAPLFQQSIRLYFQTWSILASPRKDVRFAEVVESKQCDEIRPACSQCIKSKRDCSGYRNVTNLYFHDETFKTSLKASQVRVGRNTSKKSTSLVRSDADALRSKSLRGSLGSNDLLADSLIELPRAIPQTQEEQALCYFFSEYIATSNRPANFQGFMGCLEKLYSNAERGSPLNAATSATALAAFSVAPGRRELKSESRKRYGAAVSRLKVALSDPIQARSDGTLISVLLFGLFESLTCDIGSLSNWAKHNDGAVALIEARGESIFESPVSEQLFYATRSQMVINHISRCEPMEQSLYLTGGWNIPFERHKDNAANGLAALAMKLPSVRAAALRVFGLPINAETAGEVLRLMKEVKLVDEEIAAWEAGIPESWNYNTCASTFTMIDLDHPETTEIYPGPVQCYCNVWVADIWNKYRTYRIFAQAIVLNCIEWLIPTAWGHVNTFQYHSSTRILQQMVDDVCASIPFHLGIPSSTSAEISFFVHSRKDFDALFNPSDPFKRQRGFQALGGYFLVWPLFVAASVSCIPEIQKRWIRGRMTYIGARYGFNQSTTLAALGSDTQDWYYKGIRSVSDFTRPPKNPSSIS
ncbi:MAG: hypothetical protein Q9187_006519 [Circinaria calcarea]